MGNQYPRLLILVVVVALAACGKKPGEPRIDPGAQTGAAMPAPAVPPAAEVPATPLPRSSSPEGASVFIVSPRDGDTVSSPVKVVFGLKGMTLAPAGDAAPNSGHHHLLVDVAAPDLGQPIPKDANHLHFGQAQTEADITLAPGRHTLQLLFGDSNHVPHNPPLMSAPISVTVK